jgi:predicted ATPase
MVGRDAELRAITTAIAAASRGSVQVVAISGKAGIGKSRLGAGRRDLRKGRHRQVAARP